MTLLLVIVLLVVLLGGGYYGQRQWGAPGGLGAVGIVLVIVLLCLLFGVIRLPAQEPSPAASAPTPAVVTVNGAPAAVVPAPSDASPAEVQAVAEQSAENLKAVASGEVSLAEATRDPTSGAPDPGSGSMFWLLSIIFGMVIRPITDVAVERIKGLDNRLSAACNVAVLLAVYIGAWAAFHGSNPGLPQDVAAWVIAGFAAAGLGSATTAGARSIGGSQRAVNP